MTRATLDSRKIAAARVWAAARMPYLASALFATVVRPAEESGTVAIDEAWTVRADPHVVDSLDTVELGRLLLHLVFHVLRDHADRATAIGADRLGWWNRCTDAEVNDDLAVVDAVPASAPDLPRTLGVADNRLAEEYYATQGEGARSWDCGSGADGQPRPWDTPGPPALSGQQAELMRARTAADIQQAYLHEPGSVPLGLLRWAESILPSHIDWRRLLAAEIRRALTATAGSIDYTYRRPSRRGAAARPALLPSLFRPVPHVAIVCDTSGSMHDELLGRALTEVEALLTSAGLRAGHLQVLAVDTEVHTTRTVTRASQVTLAGGGGTDMGRGINAAARLKPKPEVIIVLTDGHTPWPARGPRGTRVVVGVLTDQRAAAPPVPAWARHVVIDDHQTRAS